MNQKLNQEGMHRYTNPSLNYGYYWKNEIFVLKKGKIAMRNVLNMHVLGKAIATFKLCDFFFGIYKFCKTAHDLKT